MTKEELIKEFDDKFWYELDYKIKEEVQYYIFNEIIPEVLKNLLPQYKTLNRNIWHDFAIDKIKQKAKENFWIEL